MKYLSFILFSILLLTSCGATPQDSSNKELNETNLPIQADLTGAEKASDDLYVNYKEVDMILADIAAEMSQPNVLKDDILRGWYLGGKSDKKYGTPDTWIFVEDGENSKWMSPNILEEEELIDDRQLCKETAGTYYASCLQTSDFDCEYVEESHCECISGSKWKDGQGCIMVTERGTYVSINNSELQKGWYYGLPNQKKLNTPSDWDWVEKGRESVWQKTN